MKQLTNQMAINTQRRSAHKGKKRLYIVNRTRFVLMSLLTLIILTTIISYLSGIFVSEATTLYNQIQIKIAPGDTLWNLASQYNYYDEDIRDVIHRIKVENHMKSSELIAGNTLIIPISHN